MTMAFFQTGTEQANSRLLRGARRHILKPWRRIVEIQDPRVSFRYGRLAPRYGTHPYTRLHEIDRRTGVLAGFQFDQALHRAFAPGRGPVHARRSRLSAAGLGGAPTAPPE